MALIGSLLCVAHLVGSDTPTSKTFVDIIAEYDAEPSETVITFRGKLESDLMDPEFEDAEFHDNNQLTITELYYYNDTATVCKTSYTKQKSPSFWNYPLRYIKGKTTSENIVANTALSREENLDKFVDTLKNGQRVSINSDDFNIATQLIATPQAKLMRNISACDLHSAEKAPKIAVTKWGQTSIFTFDPSPARRDGIDAVINAKAIQQARIRKSNQATRKALLSGIFLAGAATACAASSRSK